MQRRLGEAPPGDGRPWLFGIARHVLSNRHRAGRRRTRLGGRLRTTLVEEVTTDVAQVVAERERIRQALLQLRPADRELVVLVSWDRLERSICRFGIGDALDSRLSDLQDTPKRSSSPG